MDKEQILALAEEQGAVANLKQHFNMAGDSIVFTPEELEAFFNAAIAKAEQQAKELSDSVAQKVAAACALQVATETRFHWLDAARVAKEIRSGEWRKFVKEV